MQLRYNYRIEPEPGQRVALARALGCARVVFNDAVAVRRQAHLAGVKLRDAEVQRYVITLAKQTTERAWLAEVSSVVLVQAVGDAHAAHRNFLASITGKRGERKVGPPRFLRNHERRLRKAQKALSRKEKGSANRQKARARVARVHARVADCRRDWLHQTTTRLIRENQAIYLENLAVNGLARTRLAKSVHGASWGAFRRMLEEKAARYGRHIGIVGRFEPTSQTCSACGRRDGRKPLHIRVWQCAACDVRHDRDHNAAKNILAAGQAERLNACGAQVRPGAISAPRREAGTHQGAARTPCADAVGILAL